MTRTHRQKVARQISDTLGVPYRSALSAYTEATRKVFSHRIATMEDDIAPAYLNEWLEGINALTDLMVRHVQLRTKQNKNLADLETITCLHERTRILIEDIGRQHESMDRLHLHRYLDIVVVQAAQGKFTGPQHPYLKAEWPYLSESIWDALVRQGFATRHDPRTHPDGYCIEFNELGIQTFLTEGGVWNNNLNLLFGNTETNPDE